jgi:hypothetical protein
MLSEAMIRLHAKHGGRAAALLTFLILTLFNATRAVFWTLLSPLGRRFAERARHFRQVILRMPSTWPQEA